MGKCLRTLRRRVRISQENLANEAGVERGYMGKLERGLHSPSLHVLYRLFPVLEVDFVQFASEFEAALQAGRKKKRNH